MLFTPSPCHKLSHLLGLPSPPSCVTYFMDGPYHLLLNLWFSGREKVLSKYKLIPPQCHLFRWISKFCALLRLTILVVFRYSVLPIANIRGLNKSSPSTCNNFNPACWCGRLPLQFLLARFWQGLINPDIFISPDSSLGLESFDAHWD